MATAKHSQPAKPTDEAKRLLALKGFNVLDTAPEVELDDITRLASQICGVPIALISLVDENRQWFKSRVGLSATETPRDVAFCAHAILESKTFIVEDALKDHRFSENPLVVSAPKVRFYAGAPLTTSAGYKIGTLCVIDHEPRKLSPDQTKSLEAPARQVIVNFENKKLKSEAIERENFLSSVVSMLPHLVSYIDKDFTYRYVNSAHEDWYNVSSDEIVGKTMTSVAGEKAFNLVRPYAVNALKGEKQKFELEIPFKFGGQSTAKSILAQYIPDFDDKKAVKGFYAVVIDITSTKQSEKEIFEKNRLLEAALEKITASEKSFSAIFENSPLGIIQLDSRLKFVSANPAFAAFLGYSRSELLDRTILDVTYPEDLKKTTEAAIAFPKEDGRELKRFEKRYVHKNGQPVWCLVNSRAVKLSTDGEQFLFSVIENITESRNKEAALSMTKAKLIASSKMASLGEMAGGVAHEINNPLAIIRGKAQVLISQFKRGQVDPQKSIDNLEVISKTVERIGKIVIGLSTFSRSSESNQFEKTSMLQIFNDTKVLCQERFVTHDIPLSINCPEGIELECRPTEISQVLLNLLNNSFDAIFNLQSKWVKVDVTTHDKNVRIKISDSGTGIPAELATKMMEPFFTTKEVGKGTGLGLSISRGIAESHHGALTYDFSAPNTTFYLDLPMTQPTVDTKLNAG